MTNIYKPFLHSEFEVIPGSMMKTLLQKKSTRGKEEINERKIKPNTTQVVHMDLSYFENENSFTGSCFAAF